MKANAEQNTAPCPCPPPRRASRASRLEWQAFSDTLRGRVLTRRTGIQRIHEIPSFCHILNMWPRSERVLGDGRGNPETEAASGSHRSWHETGVRVVVEVI